MQFPLAAVLKLMELAQGVSCTLALPLNCSIFGAADARESSVSSGRVTYPRSETSRYPYPNPLADDLSPNRMVVLLAHALVVEPRLTDLVWGLVKLVDLRAPNV